MEQSKELRKAGNPKDAEEQVKKTESGQFSSFQASEHTQPNIGAGRQLSPQEELIKKYMAKGARGPHETAEPSSTWDPADIDITKVGGTSNDSYYTSEGRVVKIQFKIKPVKGVSPSEEYNWLKKRGFPNMDKVKWVNKSFTIITNPLAYVLSPSENGTINPLDAEGIIEDNFRPYDSKEIPRVGDKAILVYRSSSTREIVYAEKVTEFSSNGEIFEVCGQLMPDGSILGYPPNLDFIEQVYNHCYSELLRPKEGASLRPHSELYVTGREYITTKGNRVPIKYAVPDFPLRTDKVNKQVLEMQSRYPSETKQIGNSSPSNCFAHVILDEEEVLSKKAFIPTANQIIEDDFIPIRKGQKGDGLVGQHPLGYFPHMAELIPPEDEEQSSSEPSSGFDPETNASVNKSWDKDEAEYASKEGVGPFYRYNLDTMKKIYWDLNWEIRYKKASVGHDFEREKEEYNHYKDITKAAISEPATFDKKSKSKESELTAVQLSATMSVVQQFKDIAELAIQKRGENSPLAQRYLESFRTRRIQLLPMVELSQEILSEEQKSLAEKGILSEEQKSLSEIRQLATKGEERWQRYERLETNSTLYDFQITFLKDTMEKHGISIPQMDTQDMEGRSKDRKQVAIEMMGNEKRQRAALQKLDAITQEQQKVRNKLLGALSTWADKLIKDKVPDNASSPELKEMATRYLPLLRDITSKSEKKVAHILYTRFEEYIKVLAQLANKKTMAAAASDKKGTEGQDTGRQQDSTAEPSSTDMEEHFTSEGRWVEIELSTKPASGVSPLEEDTWLEKRGVVKDKDIFNRLQPSTSTTNHLGYVFSPNKKGKIEMLEAEAIIEDNFRHYSSGEIPRVEDKPILVYRSLSKSNRELITAAEVCDFSADGKASKVCGQLMPDGSIFEHLPNLDLIKRVWECGDCYSDLLRPKEGASLRPHSDLYKFGEYYITTEGNRIPIKYPVPDFPSMSSKVEQYVLEALPRPKDPSKIERRGGPSPSNCFAHGILSKEQIARGAYIENADQIIKDDFRLLLELQTKDRIIGQDPTNPTVRVHHMATFEPDGKHDGKFDSKEGISCLYGYELDVLQMRYSGLSLTWGIYYKKGLVKDDLEREVKECNYYKDIVEKANRDPATFNKKSRLKQSKLTATQLSASMSVVEQFRIIAELAIQEGENTPLAQRYLESFRTRRIQLLPMVELSQEILSKEQKSLVEKGILSEEQKSLSKIRHLATKGEERWQCYERLETNSTLYDFQITFLKDTMEKHGISIPQMDTQDMEGSSEDREQAATEMMKDEESQRAALQKLDAITQEQQKVRNKLLGALSTWADKLIKDKVPDNASSPKRKEWSTQYLPLLRDITSKSEENVARILYTRFEEYIKVLAQLANQKTMAAPASDTGKGTKEQDTGRQVTKETMAAAASNEGKGTEGQDTGRQVAKEQDSTVEPSSAQRDVDLKNDASSVSDDFKREVEEYNAIIEGAIKTAIDDPKTIDLDKSKLTADQLCASMIVAKQFKDIAELAIQKGENSPLDQRHRALFRTRGRQLSAMVEQLQSGEQNSLSEIHQTTSLEATEEEQERWRHYERSVTKSTLYDFEIAIIKHTMKKHGIEMDPPAIEGSSKDREQAAEAMGSGEEQLSALQKIFESIRKQPKAMEGSSEDREQAATEMMKDEESQRAALQKLDKIMQEQQEVRKNLLQVFETWAKKLLDDKVPDNASSPKNKKRSTILLKTLSTITSQNEGIIEFTLCARFEESIGVLTRLANKARPHESREPG